MPSIKIFCSVISPTQGWHHYENKTRLKRGLPIFASQSQFGGHAAILKEPFNGSLSRVKSSFFSCGGEGFSKKQKKRKGINDSELDI
ncbi:hypothetical protein CEXT_305091 [Caerostris extrusa]|uniref:Ycf15 n=1 Tax=Caerostris extrusa TaxID=172846 RepID=A0AAV4NVE3_CAEEX|nr:hypothetical protein CEXT_305091 [Caerostris extrusa]